MSNSDHRSQARQTSERGIPASARAHRSGTVNSFA